MNNILIHTQLYSVMADYKKLIKNKNHSNHKSMNGLLLLIYITILMLVQHSNAKETGSSNTSCKVELTCTKCTIKAQCEWSVDQQACVNKTNNFKNSSLTVDSEEKCPRISVSTKHFYKNDLSGLEYTVKVLDDSVGFIDFLRKNNFTCNSTIGVTNMTYEIQNNTIICSIQINKSYFTNNKKSFTAFFFVKFNGLILQFDNITDHYGIIYERPCVENVKDKDCATCTWNDDGYSHYVRLCSTGNSCEGRNEVYMMHNGMGQWWNFTTQKVKNRCDDINVTSVNPLSGSLSTDTNITITVKNHDILSNNRTVNVTVAGTVCKEIGRTGTDMITCTMSPPPDDTYNDTLPSGPVSIKYIVDNGELNVESSQTFQFDVGTTCGTPRPMLDHRQVLYGLERGLTNVTLNGFRFIKPCFASPARMFVELNGTMQFASKNCDTPTNDNQMVCHTPKLNNTNNFFADVTNSARKMKFGLEVMNFVNNKSILVNGSLTNYYYILDDYQLNEYEINSNGSVAIYGNHLQHMHHDVQIQVKNSIFMNCNVTSIDEHSFQCMPNASITTPSREMVVKIAGSLSYKVKKRLCDVTRLIWLIVILLTVIISVLACMYLFNRRSNVHKTVYDHHPVNLVELDTQTALL